MGAVGRYAPSPTGTLHLGNLRTALPAWLFARSQAADFILRIEDLDTARVRPGLAEAQLLTARRRAERERAGRPPALRLRAGGALVAFADRLLGEHRAVVDDLVVRRNDGAAAYNLAVVVDDTAQGVGEVVRGADLLETTPRQLHVRALLGGPDVTHAHVPLVLGPDATRLAKRHGAVTLADRAAAGQSPLQLRSELAASVGLAEPGEQPSLDELLARLDPSALPRKPTVLGA